MEIGGCAWGVVISDMVMLLVVGRMEVLSEFFLFFYSDVSTNLRTSRTKMQIKKKIMQWGI